MLAELDREDCEALASGRVPAWLQERCETELDYIARSPKAAVKPSQIGGLVVDRMGHSVTWNGRPVTLQPFAFAVLELLARRPGVVLSRQMIVDLAGDESASERSVDSAVVRIRRELAAVGAPASLIQTVKKVGYKIEVPS